ncbi:MAG TPA: tubulin-like doman-containing protein [Pyrinomonadaceae bacterium]|nr:tubulin-like doman-containing protein [Pyrinomonadaceae bacterium]
MDRRKRFWVGLIALLLAPLLVLAAFAAYVYIANARPQAGELQTRVSPQVVMPWGEAVYYMDYAGFKPTPTPPPSPAATPAPTPAPTQPSSIDMVFVVDESSSMTDSIDEMAAAAQNVVQDLAKERRGRIRYSAIRFDESAETQTDWTDNPDQLSQGLSAIAQSPRGRGTDGRVAFAKLGEQLATARPGADKVVIFYTDGLIASCPTCADEIMEAARVMRENQQVNFYSVGLPYRGSDPLMIEVTADPDKVFDPLNPTELARMFQEIKVAIAPSASAGSRGAPSGARTPRDSSGQLSHRLDGRHFATPLEDTNWMPGGGAINLPIRPVPQGPTTYAHPLVPLSAGLWDVGVEPPRLVFFDKAGQRHQIEAQRRPLLLKITYFTLLLMLLPALAWALGHARRRKPARGVVETRELDLPPIPEPTFPGPLPALPRPTLERLPPVPTLFIGIGGAGRRALHAVRADLKQAHLGRAGEPYSFLWIDTDTQEAERELLFEDWGGYPIEPLVAPAAVRQTEEYLPEPARADHLLWFNPYAYRDAPPPTLNLADGAKGERPLARLALFNWLSAPNGILPTLVEKVKQLAALPAADGERQVVIFASADGGVGSGWFLDLGRLFQRIARQQGGQGLDAQLKVIGVLSEDPERRHPENKQALAMELETALTTRRFPQRVTYVPGETLLDQVEAQSPYHWIFSVAAGDQNSAAAQCGELASVLVERLPRSRLLDQAQTISSHAAVATTTFGAHVLPTLIYDQVRCELFLRLLGPDILLDVVPDAQGGLKPQPVSADRPGQLLDDWSRAETPGSPLQLLLRAALDPAEVTGFLNLMESTSSAPLQWLGDAFASAVTRQLQGHAAGDSGWERGWRPGEAVATLRLLATRLERNVKPELRSRTSPAQPTEATDHVISLAESAAADLERWVQDFCRALEQVAAQRSQLEQARRHLLRLQGRVYLDLEVRPEQIQHWARSGLEAWVGTPDTISAIRQRLFFAVKADGDRASVSVESFIAKERRGFAAAGEVTAEIDRLTRTLALNVPAMRIGTVLADMTRNRRREVGRELVRTESQPQQVLLILPKTTELGREEQQAVEEFGNDIPKPPSHGPRSQQLGDDHSAVRRLELNEAAAERVDPAGRPLTFVEMPESIAESVRRRAETKYKIALPIFPPQLRIALAHPTAFRSFARAYKAGHIVLRQDDNGSEQWSIADTGQFLTFGRESSLAHAATNYVRDVKDHPEAFAVVGEGGNFLKLEQWRDRRVDPDLDALTQIAVDVYE